MCLRMGIATMAKGEKMPTTKEVDENRCPSKAFFTYNVDAVEVVRCKDCVYQAECAFAEWLGRNGNGFCSSGERRENAEKIN